MKRKVSHLCNNKLVIFINNLKNNKLTFTIRLSWIFFNEIIFDTSIANLDSTMLIAQIIFSVFNS